MKRSVHETTAEEKKKLPRALLLKKISLFLREQYNHSRGHWEEESGPQKWNMIVKGKVVEKREN